MRAGLACTVVAAAGCATVDPGPDYRQATEQIRQHTGSKPVFNPDLQSTIGAKVDDLLDGGVTCDEAVSVALLNNPRFQGLFQEIGASRADVVQAGLWSNPDLSLSIRFPEGGGRSNVNAGLAQQIVDLWQIPVRKRIAESQLEQMILSVVDEAVRLTAEVRRDYYEVVALQRTEQLVQEHLDLVKRSLAVSQARFDAGEISEVDVNLMRSAVHSVQLEAISLRRDRERAINALERVMGTSRREQEWTLADTWPERPETLSDEHAALLTATERRVDLRASAQRIKMAEARLEQEYRKVWPNVTVGLEGERLERRALPGRKVLADTARASIANGGLTAPGIQSRAERRRERSQIIDLLLGPTLDVTLPVWDQNQAQIAKAGYQVRQMRAALEDLLDSVAQDVANAIDGAHTASELVKFFEQQALPQAKASVEAAERAYEAGEQNVLTVIDAQATLIAQQRAHVSALRDLALAQTELERAVGGRAAPSKPDAEPRAPDAPSDVDPNSSEGGQH